MAAWDAFNRFVNSLPDEEHIVLKEHIARFKADLFAARSEDARQRLAETFIRDAHGLLERDKS